MQEQQKWQIEREKLFTMHNDVSVEKILFLFQFHLFVKDVI